MTTLPLHLARAACKDHDLPARVVFGWFNGLPENQQFAVVEGWTRNYELADPHQPAPYVTDKEMPLWADYNAAMKTFGLLVQEHTMKREQLKQDAAECLAQIVEDVARLDAERLAA
jgi:hypothetical protein